MNAKSGGHPSAETGETSPVMHVDPYRHMTVKHHFIGGIYTKELRIPPGVTHHKHRHSFDHASVLASGIADVEVDGETTRYEGPVVLAIAAKKQHAVTAVTPCVWLCQHATDRMDPDGIDEELVANA